MWRSALLAVVAALSAVAIAASGAGATIAGTPFSAPYLAGSASSGVRRSGRVARRPTTSAFRVFAARAGGSSAMRLATIPALRGENFAPNRERDFPRLSAADGFWIVARTASVNQGPVCLECYRSGSPLPPIRPHPLLSEALAARFGGRPVTLVRCRRPSAYGALAVATEGGRMAYSRGGCLQRGRDQIVVRLGPTGRVLARLRQTAVDPRDGPVADGTLAHLEAPAPGRPA